MPVTRINTFEAKPGQAAELRDFLASVIDLIVSAPGCRSVELLVSRDAAERLAIVETWDSVDAHKAAASRATASRLSAIQIDSVNVLARAHYLPAFSRYGRALAA